MPVLESFVQATEVLAREDTATGSQVFVLLNSLFQTLEEKNQDPAICRDLKAKIKQGLMKRFQFDESGTPSDEIVKSSPLALALALDPRYKSLKVLSVSQKVIIKSRIEALLRETTTEGPEARAKAEGAEPPSKQPRVTDCLLGDVVLDLALDSNENEYNHFLEETVRIPNPLQWWKVSQTRYSKLACLAKQYLSIPATSVPSEWVFSIAGLTVSKLRANLEKDTVNEILFLNKHYRPTLSKLLQEFPPDQNSGLFETQDSLSVNSAEPEPTGNEDVNFEIKHEVDSQELETYLQGSSLFN